MSSGLKLAFPLALNVWGLVVTWNILLIFLRAGDGHMCAHLELCAYVVPHDWSLEPK